MKMNNSRFGVVVVDIVGVVGGVVEVGGVVVVSVFSV